MKVLILCVDRDDDLGRKASIKGPVLGEKSVSRAAAELVRKDPSETDANAMFAALKLFDEIKEKEKEVAVLTGSVRVGYHSDRIVGKQLDMVLKKFPADGVILVSDGKEDELLVPVVESKVPILSMHRLVVHSGEELKGAYYTLRNFFGRASEDRGLGMYVFGVPAIMAIIFAFFGLEGWRWFFGVVGLVLAAKALKIDRLLARLFKFIRQSFVSMSSSFLLYLLSVLLLVIAVIQAIGVTGETLVLRIANTIMVTTQPCFYSALFILLGLAVDAMPDKRKAYHYVTMGVSIGVVALVFRHFGMWLVDTTYPLSYVITTTILGSLVVIVAKLAGKYIHK
ncbi:MAG TPA: DUF373 family protein [archaeon]|nr:DUF373 family protein [archaeon]